jgi:hypothetical protein
MKCTERDCKKLATHYQPYHLCDDHWAGRYSMQNYKGKLLHFKDLFELLLKERGIWKEGEVMDDALKARCKELTRGSPLLKREST